MLAFSRWHSFIMVCLGVTWLFDGFEVTLLSVFNGDIQDAFGVNQAYIGFTSSLYLLGAITGSLFFGQLSAVYGRKKLFQITLVLYLISVISISFS